MKRFSILLFSMLIMFSAVSSAQNKSLPKEWKKEYKKQLKKLEKDGWEIFGSTRSLEYALLSHFEKRCEQGDKPGESESEVMGIASVSDAKNKNLLRQKAITNSYTTYASKFVEHVQLENIEELIQEDGKEIDDFREAFGYSIEKEIKGALQPSFTVIKEINENQIDMRVFCIVDKNAALRACLRAIDDVKGQSEFVQKHEQQILDIVKKEFEHK